jgi:hypothetical protein
MVKCQLHCQSLYPCKEPPVPSEQEAGWAPEQVWTLLRTEQSVSAVGGQNHDSFPQGRAWLLETTANFHFHKSVLLLPAPFQ